MQLQSLPRLLVWGLGLLGSAALARDQDRDVWLSQAPDQAKRDQGDKAAARPQGGDGSPGPPSARPPPAHESSKDRKRQQLGYNQLSLGAAQGRGARGPSPASTAGLDSVRLSAFDMLGGFNARPGRRPDFPTVNYPTYGITGDHSRQQPTHAQPAFHQAMARPYQHQAQPMAHFGQRNPYNGAGIPPSQLPGLVRRPGHYPPLPGPQNYAAPVQAGRVPFNMHQQLPYSMSSSLTHQPQHNSQHRLQASQSQAQSRPGIQGMQGFQPMRHMGDQMNSRQPQVPGHIDPSHNLPVPPQPPPAPAPNTNAPQFRVPPPQFPPSSQAMSNPLIRPNRIGNGGMIHPRQLEIAQAQAQARQVQLQKQQQALMEQQRELTLQREKLQLKPQLKQVEPLATKQVPKQPFNRFPAHIPVPAATDFRPLMAQELGVYLPGVHGGRPNYLTSAIAAARELKELQLTSPPDEQSEEVVEYEYYETPPSVPGGPVLEYSLVDGEDFSSDPASHVVDAPDSSDVEAAQPELGWPQQPSPLTGIPEASDDEFAAFYAQRSLSQHRRLSAAFNQLQQRALKSVRQQPSRPAAESAESSSPAMFQMDVMPSDQVMAALLKQVESLHAVVYSRSDCAQCSEVESLIQEYYQVPTTVFYLDSLNRGKELLNFIGEITNSTSVPKVFICGYFIGGFEEVMQLHRAQGLMRYIQKCFTPPVRALQRVRQAAKSAKRKAKTIKPHKTQIVRPSSTDKASPSTPRDLSKVTLESLQSQPPTRHSIVPDTITDSFPIYSRSVHWKEAEEATVDTTLKAANHDRRGLERQTRASEAPSPPPQPKEERHKQLKHIQAEEKAEHNSS